MIPDKRESLLERPIYLDFNATTPIDYIVTEAMLPYLEKHFGNPSTSYVYGQRTKQATEHAREQVAFLIGASPDEIVFTSGGSESDNQAIIGIALANMRRGRHIITSNVEHPAVANTRRGRHIITSNVEHPAVANTCRYLEERLDFRVTYLPVDEYGLISAEQVRKAVTSGTILITVMHANNEVGTIEPIEEIGEVAREYGIPFHTDAAQSCGKIPVDVARLKVDLLTIAGHKLYAPKGIGALYVRSGTNVDPLIHGASQEHGRRAGTENVPYMVGLGVACELAKEDIEENGTRVEHLRDRLYARIVEGLGKETVRLNGHPRKRLPNTLNVSVRGIVGEELLATIPEIAASTGAACHSGSTEPSSVLLAMGLSREWALGALRLSLARSTNQGEVDAAAELIVDRVRAMKHGA
jgi:cysteine desulfurase